MLDLTCHCGAVRLRLPRAPDFVVDCNCSICRRNGALWAFYAAEEIELEGAPSHTSAYEWGARTLRTLRCSTCGCVTHWEPLTPEAGPKLGINLRNLVDPRGLEGVRVRHFDGAVTWTYVD